VRADFFFGKLPHGREEQILFLRELGQGRLSVMGQKGNASGIGVYQKGLTACRRPLHFQCKPVFFGRAPRRKLFVLAGHFGFFRRNFIAFMRVGGKGGRGGVNHHRSGHGWNEPRG
jgi:hypothetical protein